MSPPARARRTDAELLALVADGNAGALGELYDQHHSDVRRVLDRVTSRASDVDDLIQATFLALPKIARAFDGRDSARAWILGVAVRLAARRQRGLARFVKALSAYALHTDTFQPTRPADPERAASEREELVAFERALEKLSPKKRVAFVLVEIAELSVEGAARALDVPAGTVRTRLFHARSELRKALKGVRP